MTKFAWKEIQSCGMTNFILSGDGPFDGSKQPTFWISYNQETENLGAFFGSDNGAPETALCNGDDFFILNGDYRDSYEKLVPLGYDACKNFYDQQAAHAKSTWSD
jgi:hypothetical protein